MRLAALVLGAALLLAGCGTEYYPDPLADPATAPSPIPVIDTEEPDPTAIYLPKLDVGSTLIPLGLTGKTKDCPDGNCLEVPPVFTPEQAGWYAGKKKLEDGDEWKPGETGPAVIVGHVDGLFPDGKKGKPGIFARLKELTPGDEILVDQADGEQLRYRVTAVEQHPKAEFPWDRVMAETGKPTLQLITCGGEFDRSIGHYRDNVVVFTELVPT
ncbi:MAG TPA: class F sortase [Micromonosporaceae bacterium]